MKNRPSTCRQVFQGDVLKIVQLSFSFASFTVLGRPFSQKRGSPIGNQVSPSLYNLAVCLEEDCWVRQCWASDKLACWFLRYVDNAAFSALVDPTFYGPPVVLEACEIEELLGCRLSVYDRRVDFHVPNDAWNYRVPGPAKRWICKCKSG